jgi:diguanylate cyclase (GGDEF)-like protein/PAS domain S-box-containing protein
MPENQSLVTKLQRLETERHRSDARLSALLSSIDDIVIEIDGDGTYLDIWTRDDKLLVAPRDQLLGKTVVENLGGDVGRQVMVAVRRTLESGAPQVWEYALDVPAGKRWFRARLSPVDGSGRTATLCWVIQDVTEARSAEQAKVAAEQELHRRAMHDPLTELPNRWLFTDRLERSLTLADREKQSCSILTIDVDRFKEINDTLGHGGGDEVLRQLAKRMSAAIRASDSIARLGGDEFAVLLPRSNRRDAYLVTNRLMRAVRDPIVLHGLPLNVDISIGAVTYPDDGKDPQELVRKSDIAMYTAKRAHIGFSSYTSASDPYTPERLALIGELRPALDRGELTTYFQPQVDVDSGEVLAAEALVRWLHPTRGLMSASEFVPLVRETSLIQPLTSFVLDAALRSCAQWHGIAGRISVAVNLAERSLVDRNFPKEVEDLLRRYDLPASDLTLEITEGSFVVAGSMRDAVLTQLSAMGVRIAIDDFGVGFTSLAYLTQLPVDDVKIDESFVNAMVDDSKKEMVVRSIIDLSRNLQKRVVASGVQSAEVLSRLKVLGCDRAQGYLFSAPLPDEEFSAWIARR